MGTVGPVSIYEMKSIFMQYMRDQNRSPKYTAEVDGFFTNHIEPFYDGVDMSTVSVNEHQEFLRLLKDKGRISKTKEAPKTDRPLSHATINQARSILSSMFNVCIKKEAFTQITINPLQKISRPRLMNQRLVYWNKSEIQSFLNSEAKSPFFGLWILLLNTGLRSGEAVAVTDEQFDRFNHLLVIDRLYCNEVNDIRMVTKSKRTRTVGMNKAIQSVVYPMIKSGQVFTMPDGGLIRTDTLSKIFARACAQAGVKDIGVHGLRHTFASNYMMSGGNVYDLQKILGHSDIRTTERYAHLAAAHLQARSSVVEFGIAGAAAGAAKSAQTEGILH